MMKQNFGDLFIRVRERGDIENAGVLHQKNEINHVVVKFHF